MALPSTTFLPSRKWCLVAFFCLLLYKTHMPPKKEETQKDNELVVKDNKTALEVSFFIIKKTKRLTSALYMITSHLSDSDPLKWDLRKKGVNFLTRTLSFLNHRRQNISPAEIHSAAGRIVSDIDDIAGLLEIAFSDPSISQMNFSIVKQEFENLGNTLNRLSENGIKEYFLEREGERIVQESVSNNSGHPATASPVQKPAGFYKTENSESKTKKTLPKKPSPKKAKDKEERKDKIINYLKANNWASIKDISSVVPNCSTKTVQRELSDLVEQNVLKKKGERRWSRYALA